METNHHLILTLLVLFASIATYCESFEFAFRPTDEYRVKRQGFGIEDESDPCLTPDSVQGQCINIYNCEPLFNLLTNQQTPEVTYYIQRSHCGFEGQNPKICCPPQEPNLQRRPQPRPTPKPQPDSRPRPVSRPQPSPRPEAEPENVSDNGFPTECGKSVGLGGHRITAGRPANLRAWPWMVALGYDSRSNPSWNCGGALVSDRYIVTAAHCIINRRMTVARLGDLVLNSTDDGANHVDIPIDRAIPHPRYNPTRRTSDIGIVRLRDAAQFNQDVRPICLPFAPQQRNRNVNRLAPFIIGWGSLAYNGNQFPVHLQEAQIEVKSTEECAAAYAQLPRNGNVDIDERVICAGGSNKDACRGDSGGPLMLVENDVYYLYGVVAYGHKCAVAGFPGVYTRVTEFLDWIQSNAS